MFQRVLWALLNRFDASAASGPLAAKARSVIQGLRPREEIVEEVVDTQAPSATGNRQQRRAWNAKMKRVRRG